MKLKLNQKQVFCVTLLRAPNEFLQLCCRKRMGDVFASKNPMPGPGGRCMAVWKRYDMYSPTHSSHRIFVCHEGLTQTSFHIGLMEEILHHLKLVVYPIVYRVWDTFQVVIAGFPPSTDSRIDDHFFHGRFIHEPTLQEGGQGVKGVLAIAGDGPAKDEETCIAADFKSGIATRLLLTFLLYYCIS